MATTYARAPSARSSGYSKPGSGGYAARRAYEGDGHAGMAVVIGFTQADLRAAAGPRSFEPTPSRYAVTVFAPTVP